MAAAATLLAAAPLSAIFDTWTWLLQCILAVGLVAGAAVLTRTLRFPTWAQAIAMVGVLLLTLTWMFPSGDELLSLIPSPATFNHFGELFTEAGTDTRSYGVPVPDRDGLLFIAVLGIGTVAIAVDMLAVVARKPALAGLPMLAIYSVPVAVYLDSVPMLTFVIGATGFLWLLVADNVDRVRRFGRRFTGDGRDVDVWEPSPLAAAGRRLAVIGMAVAVLLPLVVPGINTGLLNSLTQVGAGTGVGGNGTGGNGRINLFALLSGQLNQAQVTNYVRVTTNEPDPFYLRFGVADVITQEAVTNRTPTGRPLSRGLDDPRQNGATAGVQYTQYHADVEITNDFNQTLAPVYSTIIDTDGLDGAWLYDPNTQVVFSNRTTTRGRKYSFDYVRAKYTPAQLRTAEALARDDPLRTQFTAVPDDPEVQALVAGLIKNQRTEYDKISAIYRYFSRDNGFTYSLQTTDPQAGKSAIVTFLKEGKAGYCQQYAAAMAWMAREAGIPARVAFGFTLGSTRDGDAYVLTNRNAHAWTEVYLDGFGWVPFDATPAAAVVGSARSAWAEDPDAVATPSASSTATVAPGTDPSAAPGAAQRPDRDVDNGALNSPGAGIQASVSSATMLTMALVAVFLALLAVPALRRILVRRRRHSATIPKTTAVATGGPAPPDGREVVVTTETVQAREDAHAAWDELVDTMIDYRVPVDPTETPRHTAQRLVREAELTDSPAESAVLLGRAEERARYARQPLQGGELTVALGQVRRSLARTATKRTRIVALLLPPSVMLRWRMGLGDMSARWVGLFSTGRDWLIRFSPRRLLAGRTR
ncbi:transglutaminase [Amorphoplanes digitatis]|nr:transglutaminase [Actinoplanes digitatis]